MQAYTFGESVDISTLHGVKTHDEEAGLATPAAVPNDESGESSNGKKATKLQ
jgi:hypothetical protein